MYRLKRVGEGTEPCGTPTCITLGVDISPSTETLNFIFDRKELISLIKLIENSNLDSLHSKPVCYVVSKVYFNIQEHRGRRHFVVEVKGHVVR
jgi:hypothetical protein